MQLLLRSLCKSDDDGAAAASAAMQQRSHNQQMDSDHGDGARDHEVGGLQVPVHDGCRLAVVHVRKPTCRIQRQLHSPPQ